MWSKVQAGWGCVNVTSGLLGVPAESRHAVVVLVSVAHTQGPKLCYFHSGLAGYFDKTVGGLMLKAKIDVVTAPLECNHKTDLLH